MSIYSGFATRQQQQTYDQCLQTAVYLIQRRLLKFYKGECADEQKFILALAKLYSQMRSMQKHKYLQPHSSRTFQQLLHYLKVSQQSQNVNKSRQQSSNPQDNRQWVPVKQLSDTQKLKPKQEVKIFQETNSIGHNHQTLQLVRPKSTHYQRHNKIGILNKNIDSNPQAQQNINEGRCYLVKNSISGNSQHLTSNSGLGSTIQHILNSSASRLVSISRNQARSYANQSSNIDKQRSKVSIKAKRRSSHKSKQQIKFSIPQHKRSPQKQQYKDQQDWRQSDDLMRNGQVVDQIVKSYMNKAKNMYIKSCKKRRSQINRFKLA